MAPGQKKNVYFKAKNKTGDDLKNVRFGWGSKGAANFAVRFFRGKTNITDSVNTGSGHKFNLDKGGSAKFRMRIKQKQEGAMLFFGSVSQPFFSGDSLYGAVNV